MYSSPLDPKDTGANIKDHNEETTLPYSGGRELIPQNARHFHNNIPKHLTTFDEKYVLSCLELIRNYSLRASPWDLAEIKGSDSHFMASLAVEHGDSTICTVSGSQSMINILNSPLLQQFAFLDGEVKFERKALSDVTEPQEVSHTLQTEVNFEDWKHPCAPIHTRFSSISSTNSTCSDRTSSSIYTSSFQGMLQCTWKDGLPHHIFTVDDKREVYVANLLKVHSSDSKHLDYVYSFHLRKNALEAESVGKMRVSTSIIFSNDYTSEIRETRFVLSVSNENAAGAQMSTHAVRKNKGLGRKVVDAFRPSQSYKHKHFSKFGDSYAISEDTLWDPSNDVDNHHDNKNLPNFELAAIVVKELCKSDKEVETGGWGLKFLKKSRNNVIPSGSFRNTEECSRSVNVVIPAGLHGGPRTGVGGPASLTERWISGGRCDCGGWDIGCPLTVLQSKSRSEDSNVDNSSECKSVDLFLQGSKQEVPTIKMVNIHEGLYYIHFQSTLSSLQSFAIAAAVIHSHNPDLHSKLSGASWI